MTYDPDTATVEPRTKDEWLDIMLADGTSLWGTDILEREDTYIEKFYDPFASRLAELERELKKVHEALRLDDAESQELDYIGERLGVKRLESRKASGNVTFSRSTDATKDYLIQQGTVVSTSGDDNIKFETVEPATLASGTQSVSVDIEGRLSGSQGNVASGTITEDPTGIVGVESINNSNPLSGGRDRESDDAYRERIQTSVGEIDTTSGQQIYNTLTARDYIKEVQYIDNSSNVANNNLGPHEAEVVVDAEPGYKDDIAQAIFDNLAMGANLQSGNFGSAETGTANLDNGQSFTIDFSVPTKLDIYIDIDVELDGNVDHSDIKNAITRYIGGELTNGERVYGDLSVGDDVIYGEVDYTVRDIEGVYDIPTLEVGTSSSPTGTSNITVSDSERPRIVPSNITVSTTSV